MSKVKNIVQEKNKKHKHSTILQVKRILNQIELIYKQLIQKILILNKLASKSKYKVIIFK